MKVVRKENTLCPSCMNMHDVQIVNLTENTVFKGVERLKIKGEK